MFQFCVTITNFFCNMIFKLQEYYITIPPSLLESQFSTVIPYLEKSTQSDQTHDSVFTHQPRQQSSDSATHDTLPTSPPEPPVPRRSARSTKGASPVHFGKVYIYGNIVSKVAEAPKYRQILFVPCILMINYTILLWYRCIYY